MNHLSPRGFNFLPPAVKNILIINGIVFLATLVLERIYGIDLSRILGLHFYKGEDFAFYQYITYMFMHGSFTHLLFNMLALWMFGYILENIWGSKRFLIFYLVTGLGAAFTHTLVTAFDYYSIQSAINTYALQPNVEDFSLLVMGKLRGSEALFQFIDTWKTMPNNTSFAAQSVEYAHQILAHKANIPTVGASGSVFGILLAFGMMFPNQLIYIYFLIPIKAKYFVIIYGLIELFFGITGTNDGIAHFAHLGGMIFGFFLILYWRKHSFERWD